MDFFTNNKYVIFGAGDECEKLLNQFPIIKRNTLFLVDNNHTLWGLKKFGILVYNPEAILSYSIDEITIIVAMASFYHIMKQVESYGNYPIRYYKNKKFFNPHNTIIKDFSEILLRVETTSRCNMNCSFCTHSQMKRIPMDMSEALFKKIIIEAGNLGVKTLDIRNFGEPLLDHSLADKILFAKFSGINYVFLYSNGLLLNNDIYQALADVGLDKIIVSISPEREYNMTRNGVKFNKIIDNLTLLNRSSNTKIVVSVVAPNSSEEEINTTIMLLDSYGITAYRASIHNWAVDNSISNSSETYVPCRRLWDSFTILADGRVALCCLDYDGKYILGDVNAVTIEEIINSDLYQNYRKNQLSGCFPDICKVCTNTR